MTKHALTGDRFGAVSRALQALHHELLRFQADEVGFRGTPLQLFERAAKDSAFAWLKPLRDAIVALDERRADAEPMSGAEADALAGRLRSLLESGAGPLRDNLNAAFQARPEAVWAMGAARRALGASPLAAD